MVTVIKPKDGCCNPIPTPNPNMPYPHVHDDRYYTKDQIDDKLQDLLDNDISELILGEGVPTPQLGKNSDVYIDYGNIRRPIYKKILGVWEFKTNLNELDNRILEATRDV